METKTELEETVKVHKESVQKQRAVEAQIEVRENYNIVIKVHIYIYIY